MSSWDDYKKTMQTPTTLRAAARDNDVAELTRLLDEGAPIDAEDARGYAPLMLAAYGGHDQAFEYLLARGADPNSSDRAGNSVLMGAAFKGHRRMVETLLAIGADPQKQNHAGLDALGFASMFGRAEIVAVLSERAAVPPLCSESRAARV